MKPADEWENEVVLDTVQAMLATVPPWVQAVSVSCDYEARVITLYIAFAEDNPVNAEIADDIATDIEIYQEHKARITTHVWVGTDRTEWPGRDGRYVFAAYDSERYAPDDEG